ncbi:MAG: UDP-N-acetylmuramate dehydrogenase [Paludibacteraceae bacterium]|nr:UDP-N-acetylmuramate dehydrogenase [Paludibacteraceae bacterium]
MIIKSDFSLLKNNTFGIDVKCRRFVEYSSVDELQNYIKAEDHLSETLHIGGGSNLLFLNNFEGTILHCKMKTIDLVDENQTSVFLRVSAGVVWDDFVKYCVDNGYYGAENLSYIPGEVGAAPVQNVGAYGVEAKDIIYKVEVADAKTAELKEIDAADCCFGYRYSKFKTDWKGLYYVHHVVFKLSKEASFKLDYGKIKECLGNKQPTLQAVREAIIAIRKDKLPEPSEIGSAGSFFKNPIVERGVFDKLVKEHPQMPFYNVDDNRVKIPAGWLIEQCGWKGKNYKNVGVYEKQSLIIVNRGGATGAEVEELANKICEDVYRRFDIKITPEVCYI